MYTEYRKEYSKYLDREMEFKVYGHDGKPCLVFPPQDGKFTDYENFKIIAKNDRIIRQQAGKILGDDLLEYIASGEEKDSDFLKKIPKNILSRILKTIQEKRINKKQLISSDDE